ncbi:MAG: ferredoxin [Smithella sp. PtaU1.Bin162]|nr:MAG: ferredoxin [Smithella sp. PtaU1.Bin162]
MKRKIIKIDEEKCTGCGLCIPNCHEQAIKIINGKARLINDVYCDGLGACLGECPEGALLLEEREAEPFDEKKVLENLVQKETTAMEDYLKKLAASGNTELHKGYGDFLRLLKGEDAENGCTGVMPITFEKKVAGRTSSQEENTRQSELAHWPIQLHLINPSADFLCGADVVLTADCVAYARADFHNRFLKGKSLAIACPKLDRDIDVYVEKIRSLVDETKANTLTIIMMQVPCCRELLQISRSALTKAKRKIPVQTVIIGTQGEVLSEEWTQTKDH